MPVDFTCPACSESVSVSRRYAGERGRCPRCTALVDVPPAPSGSPDEPPTAQPGAAAPGPAAGPPSAGPPSAGPPSAGPPSAGPPSVGPAALAALGLVGLLGAALLAGALALALRRPVDAPPAAAPPDREPVLAPLRQVLAGLERDLAALPTEPAPRADALARARAALDRLVRSPLATSPPDVARLAAAGERLAGLDRPRSDGPAAPSAGAAWAALRLEALRVAANRAAARPTGLRGAAAARLGLPRQGLLREVARAEGPDALVAALSDARWHGVLGPAGYDALLRALEPDRAALAGPALTALEDGLRAQRDAALDLGSALGAAEAARASGDHAAARAAVAAGPRAEDPWFRAARDALDRGDPLAAAGPDEPATAPTAGSFETPAGPTSADPGPTSGPRPLPGDWRARFRTLAKGLRATPAAQRPAAVSELAELVRGAEGIARKAFEDCQEVVELLDEHEPVFAEPPLAAARRPILELYFEGALARATGPMTLLELDRWCARHDQPAWRERLAPLLKLVVAPAADAAQADQERARRLRAQAVQAARGFVRERADDLARGLLDTTEWLRAQAWCPAAARARVEALVAVGVERASRRGATSAAAIRAGLAAVEHREPPDEKAARRLEAELARRLDKVRDGVTGKLLKAVDQCLDAGEPGLGFDLLGYLLQVDPEHERAHKGLGHVKVDGRWLRRHEAERWRQGWAWDPRLAWVRRADRARYDAGEYFDLQAGGWTALAEAERVRADPTTPWVIDTEHFRLRSTAPLQRAAEVAARLEAFYLALFRQYDLFFAQRGGAALVFGVAPSQQRPLEVWFYRDRAQFLDHGKADPKQGGYYSPATHQSYFYDSGTDWSWTVLQHEVTHQVLGETSPAGAAPAWLAEGAAVFLEDARLVDGVLTVGGIDQNELIRTYRDELPRGGELSFEQITALVSQATWNAQMRHENYRAAGAAIHFLAHMDGGRYRGDLVEMLRDAYQGKPVTPEAAIGLPAATLGRLMRRYYGLADGPP